MVYVALSIDKDLHTLALRPEIWWAVANDEEENNALKNSELDLLRAEPNSYASIIFGIPVIARQLKHF